MSGRRAKVLRRRAYSTVFAPRHRVYERVSAQHGPLVADPMRRMYQEIKRLWREIERPRLLAGRGRGGR